MGSDAKNLLRQLLERTFFEAHADKGQLREIREEQLQAAAVGLASPRKLDEIQSLAGLHDFAWKCPTVFLHAGIDLRTSRAF